MSIFNETIKPELHSAEPLFDIADIVKSVKERAFKATSGFTLIDSPSESFDCNPLLYHDDQLLYFSYREEKPTIPPVLLRSEIKRLIRQWKAENPEDEDVPYRIIKEIREQAEDTLSNHARDKTIVTDYIVDLREQVLLQVGNHEKDVLPHILNAGLYTPLHRKLFYQNNQVDWHLFLQWVMLYAFVGEGTFTIERHDSWQNIYVTMGDRIEYGDKIEGRIAVNFGIESFKTTRAWAAPLLEGKPIQQMAFYISRDQRSYLIALDKDFHVKSLTLPGGEEWQQQPEHIKAAQRFSAVMEAHRLLADVMEHFMGVSEEKDFMKELFDSANLEAPLELVISEDNEQEEESSFDKNMKEAQQIVRGYKKRVVEKYMKKKAESAGTDNPKMKIHIGEAVIDTTADEAQGFAQNARKRRGV